MQSPLGQEGLPTNCQGDVCNLSTGGLAGPRAPPWEHPGFWQSCHFRGDTASVLLDSVPQPTPVQGLLLHKVRGKRKLLKQQMQRGSTL